MIRGIVVGLGVVIKYAALGIWMVLHVAFSSLYQSGVVVKRKAHDELEELRKRQADDEF